MVTSRPVQKKKKTPPPATGAITLNHHLALAGVCSRRAAVEIIRSGRVSINGKTAGAPFTRVRPGDTICLDGKPLSDPEKIYLALHKPPGYTCTLADRFATRKISELLPESLGRLYPAGRLDRDSRGLVIMTNDGAFAHRLTHPSFGVEKEYRVTLSGRPAPRQLRQLLTGIRAQGETLRARRAAVAPATAADSRPAVMITLTEGRKREIRRMFHALGLEVTDLVRCRIGHCRLGSLPAGGFRVMNARQAAACLAPPAGPPPGRRRLRNAPRNKRPPSLSAGRTV